MSQPHLDSHRESWVSPIEVVVTWLWATAGPLMLAGAVVGVWRIDRHAAVEWWQRHQYAQAYVEAVFVGLLPLGLALRQGGALSDYGIQRRRLLESLSLSLGLAIAFWIITYARTGAWLDHSALPLVRFPWNIWYGVLGVVANGPLEVFFVFWLIRRTDRLFAAPDRTLTGGLLLTVVLFGLLHVITTHSVANALTVMVVFLALALIYRRTGNAVGPMLGWTLMNGMTWAYLDLLRP